MRRFSVYFFVVVTVMVVLSACGSSDDAIREVDHFEPIDVLPKTPFDALDLPNEANVQTGDETVQFFISWQQAKAEYDPNQLGVQTLKGDLILSGPYSNPDDLKASIDIDVLSLDIMAYLAKVDDYTRFYQLLEASDYAEILNNDNAHTLLAPNNEAVDRFLDSFNINFEDFKASEELDDFIAYHILNGALAFETIAAQSPVSFNTLSGNQIRFDMEGSVMKLNETSRVLERNIPLNNGLIHEVDEVILPISDVGSIFDDFLDFELDSDIFDEIFAILSSDPRLLEAFLADGITLFLPNQTAFENFADDADIEIDALLNLEDLPEIISYHIISDTYTAETLYLEAPSSIRTLQGERISVTIEDEALRIDDARIISSTREFDGILIHFIDDVLIPPYLRGDYE